ncbi:MAG: metallophosphoesterase [Lachnospiraceae bacterium]|nr:metallophosphoesterase [Lachnospiraceae bacterium]
MNILGIADVEEKSLWDYYDPARLADVDLMISCGDLNPDYLQFLVTMTNKTLLYVHGNHDTAYEMNPPLGCVNIDGRLYEHNGVRILGLGGCMKYKPGRLMYTESQMRLRIMRVMPQIVLKGGFDILVTHAPADGYGDLEDMPHWGYDCFNELMERFKPKLMLHGHVHQCYGTGFKRAMTHTSGTEIHNCCGHVHLQYDETAQQAAHRSALYNLYASMKR